MLQRGPVYPPLGFHLVSLWPQGYILHNHCVVLSQEMNFNTTCVYIQFQVNLSPIWFYVSNTTVKVQNQSCEASRSNTAQIRSRPSYLVRLSGHLDTTNQLLLNTDHCLPIRTNQLSLNTDRCLPIRKLGTGRKPPGKSRPRKVLTNEIALQTCNQST